MYGTFVEGTSLGRVWRRSLGIAAMVGSGAGLAAILQQIAAGAVSNPAAWVVMLVFVGAYVAGIMTGLALIEAWPHAPTWGVAFWLPQSLQVYTPLMSYQFFAPFNLGAWANGSTRDVGLSYQVGAKFAFSLGGGAPWAVGVNLFALGVACFLFTAARRDASALATRELDQNRSPQAPG